MAKILLAVNSPVEINQIIETLSMQGHTVVSVQDCQQEQSDEQYDMLLLDDGFAQSAPEDIMQQLYALHPVLCITEKTSMPESVCSRGADDYIVRPISPTELCARVENLLQCRKNSVFDLDDCHVEFNAHRAFYKGKEVFLTPQEFRLLHVLVQHRDQALTREQILRTAWGFAVEGDTRTVDVHIQKIRKKLGIENRIRTVYKVGYCLDTETK